MSWPQFLESKQFRVIARGAMIYTSALVTIGGALFTWAYLDTSAKMNAAATETTMKMNTVAAIASQAASDANAMKEGNTARAKANDDFQKEVRAGLRTIGSRVDDLVGDVGEVKGVLSAMRRDQSASMSLSSPSPIGSLSIALGGP